MNNSELFEKAFKEAVTTFINHGDWWSKYSSVAGRIKLPEGNEALISIVIDESDDALDGIRDFHLLPELSKPE